MKYALITGVSSGIGFALCKRLLKEGFYVFGSIRKQEDALRLQKEWGDRFEPLQFDVTDYEKVDSEVEKVYQKCGDIGLALLVNNAGAVKMGPVQFVDIKDFREQFEINVHSVIYLTQKLLPLLGGEKKSSIAKGRIITISSTAGVFTRPMLAPYSASKHALEAVFDGLRRELSVYGIKSILIQPGPIRTEIWRKANFVENPYKETVYEGIFDKLGLAINDIVKTAIPVDRVVDKIWKAYQAKRPKPRYLIAPKKFFFWLLMYVMPASWTDYILIKEIKKYSS